MNFSKPISSYVKIDTILLSISQGGYEKYMRRHLAQCLVYGKRSCRVFLILLICLSLFLQAQCTSLEHLF